MTSTDNSEVPRTTEAIVDAVRLTTLGLLASLPEHPKRLRVHAAGVTVDLDWRSLPAAALPSAPMAYPLDQPVVVPAAVAVDESSVNSYFVCAPAVGTFYHSPDPGKPPFAALGALVEVGQQVGIVEAMKLMLPVQADQAGEVVKVLVPDGESVEYGQRLLELRATESE
jgi:acetyl-CoA carboxylase biotin carboxyl carrier protein